MESLGKVVFYTISIILDTVIGAFVFMKLWAWFIATTFGILELKLYHCIGIVIFISYIRISGRNKKEDEEIELTPELVFKLISRKVFYGLVYLLIGYLIHLFQ
jgi:uncharacterized membrane protein